MKNNVTIILFKHNIPIQIRYNDCDMLGHVNNAIQLSYIESGRVSYFEKIIPNNNFQETGVIIAKTEIEYFEPIFLNDNLFCATRISIIKNKSFVIENILFSKNKQKSIVKSYAKSIMVCFNYNRNTSILVPDTWINKIKKTDGKNLTIDRK